MAKKPKLPPQQPPSPAGNTADGRYYASRKPSVVRKDPGIYHRSGGPKPKPPRVAMPGTVRSADEYYREGGLPEPSPSPSSAKVTAARQRAGRPAPGLPYDDDPDVVRPFVVGEADGAERAASTEILALLNAGQPAVLVHVPTAEKEAGLRAMLDLAVGRGEVTRDRLRAVAISVVPPGAPAAPPQPQDVPTAADTPGYARDEPLPADFDAFVRGGPAEEPAAPPTPTPPPHAADEVD